MNSKHRIYLSYVIIAFGIILIFCGFFVSPTGIIDNSVLYGSGELFTLAGSILGIHSNYDLKMKELEHKLFEKRQDNECV